MAKFGEGFPLRAMVAVTRPRAGTDFGHECYGRKTEQYTGGPRGCHDAGRAREPVAGPESQQARRLAGVLDDTRHRARPGRAGAQSLW